MARFRPHGLNLASARHCPEVPTGLNLVGRDDARHGRRRRSCTAAGRPVAPRHARHFSDRDCFQRGNGRPRDGQRRRDVPGKASGHRRTEENTGATHPELMHANDQAAAATPRPGKQAMSPKRILIVDDEPGVTRSLELNLEARAGYEVRAENDPASAIDTARDFRPHLVLLDVLMPHLDGCDVSARVHADSELMDTPIVFLTALANNEATGGHAVAAGSTVYLAKPVDTEELIKCIEQTLSLTAKPRRHAITRHP